MAITRDRVKKILDDLAVLQADRHSALLLVSEVLDDLQASVQQRERLNEMVEQRREPPRKLRDMSRDEQRQHFLAIAREHETTLSAILSTAQLQRLRQIALQWQGPREPNLAKTLKLTADQKDRLRAIEAEKYRNVFFDRNRKEPGATEAHEDSAKSAMQKMLAVLSPDQLQQWRSLTGKPYEGPMSIPVRPGPPMSRGKFPMGKPPPNDPPR